MSGLRSALRFAKMRARLLRGRDSQQALRARIAADPLYAHILAMERSSTLPVPDDAAVCALCGRETSLAMLAIHLEREHGIDATEIATAPIIDNTDEGAA